MAFCLVVLLVACWFLGPRADAGGDPRGPGLDRVATRFVVTHRSEPLTWTMRAATVAGSGAVVAAGLGVAAACSLLITREATWPRFFALALIGAVAIDKLGKAVIDRSRPDVERLVEAAGNAFPSGHATAATVLCASVALFVGSRRRGASSRAMWTIATVIALLVGFSRVYLGVHWTTDVVAGMSAGCLWVLLCAVVTEPRGHRRDGRGVILRRG